MGKSVLLLAVFLLSTFCVYASSEYPTAGLSYNTKENSSLSYNCQLGNNEILSCDFVQTFVRKKESGSWDEKRKGALDSFESEAAGIIKDKKICVEMEEFLKILESKKNPEHLVGNSKPIKDKNKFISAIKSLSAEEKAEKSNDIRLFVSFCKEPTKEKYLDFFRHAFEKDKKTCRIGSFSFKQKFKWIDDYQSNGAWVVISKPYGLCGTVQLDRFYSSETSGFTFWNYHAQKAVTNPQGKSGLLSCSELDEEEYLYEWKDDKSPRNLGCEYIEFSPL